MNAAGKKLRECVDRSVRSRPESIFAPFDWLPFAHFISFKTKGSRVGHARFTQVLHLDRDVGLAILRAKRDSLPVNVEFARLLSQRANACDLEIDLPLPPHT